MASTDFEYAFENTEIQFGNGIHDKERLNSVRDIVNGWKDSKTKEIMLFVLDGHSNKFIHDCYVNNKTDICDFVKYGIKKIKREILNNQNLKPIIEQAIKELH